MDEKRRDELLREYRDLPKGKKSDLDKYRASRAVVYEEQPQKRRLNKRALFGSLAAVVVVALVVPMVYFFVYGGGAKANSRSDANYPTENNSPAPSQKNDASSEDYSDFYGEESEILYRNESDVFSTASSADEYYGTASELRLTSSGDLVGYRYVYAGEEMDATITVYSGNIRLYEEDFFSTLTSEYKGAYDVRYSSEYVSDENEGDRYVYALVYRDGGREIVVEATCAHASSPLSIVSAVKR